MTTFRRRAPSYLLVMALTATALALFARPLSAGQIALSDILNVYDSGGNIVVSAFADEFGEDPNALYFIPVPGLANTDQLGNPTYLLEPDGSQSDVFGVALVSLQVLCDAGYVGNMDGLGELVPVLGFQSDSETPVAFGANEQGITLQEGNGGPFDATMYLSDFYRTNLGYTATFRSDSEAVPDNGGSLELLGASLFALGLLRSGGVRLFLRPARSS